MRGNDRMVLISWTELSGTISHMKIKFIYLHIISVSEIISHCHLVEDRKLSIRRVGLLMKVYFVSYAAGFTALDSQVPTKPIK